MINIYFNIKIVIVSIPVFIIIYVKNVVKRILSSLKNKNICVECKGTIICEYNK